MLVGTAFLTAGMELRSPVAVAQLKPSGDLIGRQFGNSVTAKALAARNGMAVVRIDPVIRSERKPA